MPIISEFKKQKLEDPDLKASLSYIDDRTFLKRRKKYI